MRHELQRFSHVRAVAPRDNGTHHNMVSNRFPETYVFAENQLPGAVDRRLEAESRGQKDRVVLLIWCETQPIPHTLAGRETLDLNGSMRRKVHNGEHDVLDVLE